MAKTATKKKTKGVLTPEKHIESSLLMKKQKKHVKATVKEVHAETDSTTDNDMTILSKKVLKTKEKTLKKGVEPTPISKSTNLAKSTSSSSSDEETIPAKPVKSNKKSRETKTTKPTKAVKLPPPAVSSSSSSSSDESSSDESTTVDAKSKTAAFNLAQKNQKIPPPQEETSSDDSSDSETSSDNKELKKEPVMIKSTMQVNESSSSSSSDEEDSDDESSADENFNVVSTKSETKKKLKSSSSSSSSSSDSSDDESMNSDNKNAASKGENALDSSDEDETADATEQDEPMTTSFDKSILRAWTCDISEDGPAWIPLYTAANLEEIPSSARYTVEIKETEQGDLPVLKLVDGASAKSFSDPSLQFEQKKRGRISLDQSDQQPAKKKFQLDTEGKQEIFVGNLPYGTTEEELRQLFEESCGKVQKIKILGQGGAAFLEFGTKEGVQSALEWNRTDYNGRKLNINLASEKPVRGAPNSARGNDGPPNSTVIVRNIPYNTSPDEVKAFFSKMVTVSHVNLPTFQDTGKMRGFAVVHLASAQDATKALQLSETQFSGRTVTIEIAHPRDPQGGPRRSNNQGPPRKNFQRQSFGREANAQPIRNHRVFKDEDDE